MSTTFIFTKQFKLCFFLNIRNYHTKYISIHLDKILCHAETILQAYLEKRYLADYVGYILIIFESHFGVFL